MLLDVFIKSSKEHLQRCTKCFSFSYTAVVLKVFNASILLSQIFVNLDTLFQQSLLAKSTDIKLKSIWMEAVSSS